jgi:uncharacterized RDD family membrane protein YckC
VSEPTAPRWAAAYLPPIPDDAKPIWKSEGIALRGEFPTRLVAMLIDTIPMIALSIGIMVMNRLMYFIIGPFACLTGCFVSTIHLLLNLGYFFYVLPLCNHRYGATWGKKVMKLRVVPNADPHGRITMTNAVLRQLGHLANFGIGYLLILGEERKAVQDYVSDSQVIVVDR